MLARTHRGKLFRRIGRGRRNVLKFERHHMDLLGEVAYRVEIALPRNGVLRAHAVETRRAAATGGSGLRVGLRLGEPWTVAADGRLAPSAVPPQPAFARPRSVARAELLHLGAAAMVLSLVEPRAALPPPLVAWLARLAAELGAPTPVRMETPSALTDAVASLWERT